MAGGHRKASRRKTATGTTIHARHANRAEASTCIGRTATIVRARSMIVLAVAATTHDARLVQACAIYSTKGIAAPGARRTHHAGHASRGKSGKSTWVTEIGHVLEAEPTGGTSLAVTRSKREVSVAIGVGFGRSDA